MEQKVELAINSSVWLKPPQVQNANQWQGRIHLWPCVLVDVPFNTQLQDVWSRNENLKGIFNPEEAMHNHHCTAETEHRHHKCELGNKDRRAPGEAEGVQPWNHQCLSQLKAESCSEPASSLQWALDSARSFCCKQLWGEWGSQRHSGAVLSLPAGHWLFLHCKGTPEAPALSPFGSSKRGWPGSVLLGGAHPQLQLPGDVAQLLQVEQVVVGPLCDAAQGGHEALGLWAMAHPGAVLGALEVQLAKLIRVGAQHAANRLQREQTLTGRWKQTWWGRWNRKAL